MGIEAAILAGSALLGAGAATYGAVTSNKARKDAKREMGAAREEQSRQNAKIEAEQKRLANEALNEKKKLAQRTAGAGRRRVRGGLFGDSDFTQSKTSTTLG